MRFTNVLIYPCAKCRYNYSSGGITCSFEMARILSNYFPNVLIFNVLPIGNAIYNKFFSEIIIISDDLNQEYNIENTLVIYGEGVQHNPLNSKYIVRWILGPVGINCGKEVYLTWGKHDLVYHFNNDINMNNKLVHKLLSYIHINPSLTNNNKNRSGTCFAIRKGKKYNTNLIPIHPDDSFYIHDSTSQSDLIDIFNSKVCFISYDPLTFFNIMAALCGCISIVNKSDKLTKEEWYKTTAIYRYLKDKNEPLYGIAYGSEEIDFAMNTIHLVKDQWTNFQKYVIENSIIPFVKDMENIDILENTVFNNYINK